MFFLSSSFRFCQPLKNDGRDELRFREVVNDFYIKERIENVSRPRLSGKVSAELTEGASWSRNEKTNLTCVRTLAPIASRSSALPSVFGGSLQLRKEERNHSF